MRESRIEKSFRRSVESLGGLCYKFTSPSQNGVPDRICILPGGHIVFVELKAPGEKPRKLQEIVHAKMRARGADVRVISTLEQVEQFEREVIQAWNLSRINTK